MSNYKLLIHCLLVDSLLLLCFATFAFGANRLSDDEVQALKDIAKILGKKDWNFIADPCSGSEYGWITPADKYSANNVTCGNCTISDAANATSSDQICHVVSIVLKAQNLTGKLPPELIRLPYLQEIDLSRNYLNGTIPREWGSLPLVNISLIGNRFTGSIPVELANISTLKSLAIDFNSFFGVLPPELGNLPNIERMRLTSNNFAGELPKTFARLTKLKDFRISDNLFFGKIPNFIQNWTNLEKLVIQGSGLMGPFPSGISLLTNLTDLRITDLNGLGSPFPQLNNIKMLKTLMLRNCNISGLLPTYLGAMKKLKTLDLSFNKLTGEIPISFSGLAMVDYMFLTGNMLNGSVPSWLQRSNIDLSYNDFTIDQGGLNLFAISSGRDTSSVSCPKSEKCPKYFYSLHINCGGNEVTLYENSTRSTKATTYEDDSNRGGPSSFYQSTKWASSNTGFFTDDTRPTKTFIWSNSSRLFMTNPQLYMNARLSPISLTYYGFCLGNGIYTVNLHFAETMFTDDKTYSSLGRRVFDIYIQGSLVQKDFNIANEAGGFGKAVVKNFTAHVTTNNTLEIRLFWAGKGTTGIPYGGVYGPLISAISVYSNFNAPAENGSEGRRSISKGEVVGIMSGIIFLLLLIFGILWILGSLGQEMILFYLRELSRYPKDILGQETTLEQDLKGVDLQTGKFTLRQIKDATKNFDIANKIGEGGFGPVYKGILSDGTVIAVKQLSAKSKQGNHEFVNEIGMISALQHPHLVQLYGCCIEGNQLLLVYEYMENNSLASALFGAKESQLKLDWPTRHMICVGIARGLSYLHEESRLKIVHRDIKATNVLLDKKLYPKISDFGMAKLNEEGTHISTRIAGTYGYMAPEYAMWGYLTDKADVYSFGILVLEMVSGRCNTTYRPKGEYCFHLLDWALLLKQNGTLLDLIDPRLGSNFNKEDVMTTINVALLCCNASAALRPTMSSVVSMLEGRAPVPESILDPSASSAEMNKMRRHFESNYKETIRESTHQRKTMSIDGASTSSTSVHDRQG